MRRSVFSLWVAVLTACGGIASSPSGPSGGGDGNAQGGSGDASASASGGGGGGGGGGTSGGSSSGGPGSSGAAGSSASSGGPSGSSSGAFGGSSTGGSSGSSSGGGLACGPIAPETGTACSVLGAACFYPHSGDCAQEECDCVTPGTFECRLYNCHDAGVVVWPDAGLVDGSGPGCPATEPPAGMPCFDMGTVCTYADACQTNCLCAGPEWVCATQSPCAKPSPPGP